ncbi:D-glycerate dehydrogenase [Candidatus Bathyarchaeota archaeon]|nr:MAG: D-glycerate dehydrogenase [Candidatus Bathyarchaeota archaeon]
MKRQVLVGVSRRNFPEDVAETLTPLADVTYLSPSDAGYIDALGESDAVIVGTGRVDGAFLARAPRLKIVARFGVGYDSVDVEACTARGVYVTHTPGVLSGAVADLTWALILSLIRKIPLADPFVRSKWAQRREPFPFGADLEGKTLGLIGLGRIGAEVAKRSQGFGVKLIYYDVVRRPELEKTLGAEFADLDELLRRSDIVSLHVPLLPSTRHLIGEREFGLMKPTALLINTSRGSVVDQRALIRALEEGEIGGAGLDVFEEEPLPLGDDLIRFENVVLTPHIGSATVETRRRMALVCAENVRAVLKGEHPPNLVPEQRDVSF